MLSAGMLKRPGCRVYHSAAAAVTPTAGVEGAPLIEALALPAGLLQHDG